MDEPKIASDAQDPDRAAVYAAEECWEEEGCGCPPGDEPGCLTEVEVVGFMVSAAVGAGWTAVPDHPPVVLFDVPDDSEVTGMHEGRTGVIHLHPRLLRRAVVLHELAHWIDDRDGHGPIFQANMLALGAAGMGHGSAAALLAAYLELGLNPDKWRMPDGLYAAGGR